MDRKTHLVKLFRAFLGFDLDVNLPDALCRRDGRRRDHELRGPSIYMLRISLFLLAGFAGLKAQEDSIPNDTVDNYATVKALLNDYYAESAKRSGIYSDYNPEMIQKNARSISFNDSTEASVNRKLLGEVFETDIILTVPQAEALVDEVKKSSNRRGKRQALPNPNSYWRSLTISYRFAFADWDWQNLIRRSLRHVESETCIRFRENGNDHDYLQFIRGSGCYSNVGRVGGRQQVSIGYGCDHLGIIAHETLHALGLWHEQSRNDRDNFIWINLNTIIAGTVGNFEKRSVLTSDNMDQPYDLGSVMHYGSRAFSIDYNRYSIQTRDSNYQQTIGQRQGLSFKDAKMINLRYCTRICPRQLPCANNGYTDPNNCNKCKCPVGYGGPYCQDVARDSEPYLCQGGERDATHSVQTIMSPPLKNNIDCYWRIRAPYGAKIELTFTRISFPCRDVCGNYVEVKSDADKTAAGPRLCCNVPKRIVSESNEVVLHFSTDGDFVTGYLGFEVNYRIIGSSRPDVVTVLPPAIPRNTKNKWSRVIGKWISGAWIPSSDDTKNLTSSDTTTTTTTTTTTQRPSPSATGSWSAWGGWSGCTVSCGGCGQKKRVRACYGGNGVCVGEDHEYGTCGEKVCPVTGGHTRCRGRLVMPCNLLKELDFGTIRNQPGDSFEAESNPTTGNGTVPHLLATKKNAQTIKKIKKEMTQLRQKRYVDGNVQMQNENICEKYFSYNCPTALLTINIDYRKEADAVSDPNGNVQCCPGYTVSNKICIKQ
ncbi:hypothetical protein QR680_016803 [Steinernema hermaphroditum]|uniref:Metalloendopeptidase n=1 Tax=Steinernema hermaphroditum TaxID=289476 RepID=A0AA39HCC0_9BILA|nr:hypothetical protein QR680_016803 [Steinernema hermaphroditum]